MNNNETANNKVKAIEVKKSELKRISSIIVKRIKTDCTAIKLSKLNDDVFKSIHSQASCIDACLRMKMSVLDTASKLVELELCDTIENALKRIKRHCSNDRQSRVIKRNIALNATV